MMPASSISSSSSTLMTIAASSLHHHRRRLRASTPNCRFCNYAPPREATPPHGLLQAEWLLVVFTLSFFLLSVCLRCCLLLLRSSPHIPRNLSKQQAPYDIRFLFSSYFSRSIVHIRLLS